MYVDWKYIMYESVNGFGVVKFIPFIFVDGLDHIHVARALESIPTFPRGKWRSAGLVQMGDVPICYGSSRTMGLTFHPDDSKIIQHHPDRGGYVGG